MINEKRLNANKIGYHNSFDGYYICVLIASNASFEDGAKMYIPKNNYAHRLQF